MRGPPERADEREREALGDPRSLPARTDASLPAWNELGRLLCRRFLEEAEVQRRRGA